jgi:hypothetical protein
MPGGGTLRLVEQFDDSMTMDGCELIASGDGGGVFKLTDGSPLILANGQPLTLSGSEYRPFIGFEGMTVGVDQVQWFWGFNTVAASGLLAEPVALSLAGVTRIGFPFLVEVEPFLQHAEPGEGMKQRLRPRRIKQVGATFVRTQSVEVAGRLVPYYRAGENMELAPPLRSETYRARVMGRDFDPRWSVKQALPGRFTLLEVTTDITI